MPQGGEPLPRGDLLRLWAGLLLPPASWIVDLLGQYFLTRWANQHARVWPLWVVTATAVAACCGGAVLSWAARRRALAGHRSEHVAMAGWGLALAGYFALLIAAQSLPVLALDVRELT
jgi:hypothetical protein